MSKLKNNQMLDLTSIYRTTQETINSTTRNYASSEDFQILKRIGEGTYSVVYKVRRLIDEQIYALKKIKIQNLGKRDRESALNQVRILASIQHENIIGYKQTFFEKGCLYLVLEYADNGDLLHEIAAKKKQKQYFSEVQIWQVLLQITLALHTLHKMSIIHRDVKSANIFLTKAGAAKLGDLNVSKIINNFCETQTGTPYYASPQIWKEQPYQTKSDIWSLGCTIYEMATYYPPFVGQDLEDICDQVTNKPYFPLPKFFTKQLHKIIAKMLEKDPKLRCSSEYIIENVQKIVPQTYRNLSIVQKIKNHQKKITHKKVISVQLLKTIMFPRGKNRKFDESEVNSYLPFPSYSNSRDHSFIQLQKASPSKTINLQQLKDGIRKLKPSSLFVNNSRQISQEKENNIGLIYAKPKKVNREKSKGQMSEMKLPTIKKNGIQK